MNDERFKMAFDVGLITFNLFIVIPVLIIVFVGKGGSEDVWSDAYYLIKSVFYFISVWLLALIAYGVLKR